MKVQKAVASVVLGAVGLASSACEVPTAPADYPAPPPQVELPVPAFPEARGWGALALASCDRDDQEIRTVTNLEDSGPGSLRWAIEGSDPSKLSFVVFQVGGEIILADGVSVERDCIYVAGQTAPGDGITLRRRDDRGHILLHIAGANDVVLRYLKLRAGKGTPGQGDNLSVVGGARIVLDHLSSQWSNDEGISFAVGSSGSALTGITLQWSIVAAGLRRQSTGSLVGFYPDTQAPVSDVTLHSNLYAHNAHRNPLVFGPVNVGLVNNVVYNWLNRVARTQADVQVDLIGNYYKRGPASPSSTKFLEHVDQVGGEIFPDPSIYLQGNLSDNGRQDWQLYRVYEVRTEIPEAYRRSSPMAQPRVPVEAVDAMTAYTSVLDAAGANARLNCAGKWVSVRDELDHRIVEDVRNHTGPASDEEWDHPDDFGGYPAVDPGTACPDADGDGLPDEWEALYFESPVGADPAQDLSGDGYSNLEAFLNGLSPR